MDQIPADGTGLGPDMVKKFTLQLISGATPKTAINPRRPVVPLPPNSPPRLETPKPSHRQRRQPQTRRLWSRPRLRRTPTRLHSRSIYPPRQQHIDTLDRHAMVPSPGSPSRVATVLHRSRYVVRGLYIRGNVQSNASLPWYDLI
jgi:hypothetical protein